MDSNYDDSEDASYEEREEIEWSEYVKKQEADTTHVSLDAKDYLALGIAAMQTIFLPLVILMVVFIVFAFILSVFV